MRNFGRDHNQLRSIQLTREYTRYAEGSVLVEFGHTKVLCNATIQEGVPRFLKGKNRGWITAEYGMLPRATHTRSEREATRGKQGGRTLEIQRLIGRALRAAVDLKALGEMTIHIDCDAIQADGGRTAAITGGCVALVDALRHCQRRKTIATDPLRFLVASVSVGIVDGTPLLDLDYSEDSQAETDMNVVMTAAGDFIELQGTAEGKPFSAKQLSQMLALAEEGLPQLLQIQQAALSE